MIASRHDLCRETLHRARGFGRRLHEPPSSDLFVRRNQLLRGPLLSPGAHGCDENEVETNCGSCFGTLPFLLCARMDGR